MKKRILLVTMLVFALTLAAGAVAQADTALILSADHAIVTFPHSVVLTVGFPTSDPATATVLQMPAGASEWTTLSASVTATLAVRPQVTTAYKAWLNGVESEPTTVAVRAFLVKPQLPGSIRKNRTVTIKGTMKPFVETGAVVTVSIYKQTTVYTRVGVGKLRKSTTWALYSTQNVAISHKAGTLLTGFWSLRWMPTELGQYKVVVSHEDLGHAYSQKTGFTRVRR